jgi:uncharacterized protein DUF3303
MRMLLQVTFPHEPFNTAVRKGTAGKIMKKILDDAKPEAAYFMEWEGHRCGFLIINLENTSQIPAFAEPWFLQFHADCKFRPVMTGEDLEKAGLEGLGKKWG